MTTSVLQQDISSLLSVETMDPIEQEQFLSNVGELILESTLLRLVSELNSDQEASLQHYLETEPTSEALLEHLYKHYERFNELLEAETTAFKEEVIAVQKRSAHRVSSGGSNAQFVTA